MSSIRPLATITVLAGVGIFLYMKINETEPVLPAEVEGYQIGDIQFGEQPTVPNGGSPYGDASVVESASALHASPQTGVAAQAVAAPAFNAATPPQANSTEAAPPFGATAGPGATSTPDLPPLPTIPTATQPVDPSVVSANAAPTTEPAHDHSHPDSAAETSAHHHSAPPVLDHVAKQPPAQFSPEAETPEAGSPVSPAASSSTDVAAQAQPSLFSATRLAVQAALDRGELSQALLLLSDWYGDPSLSASESQEVNQLLSQLAGSVIYSTEHRLEPPYMVQAGERLEDIAKKYNVPWQLLAKINGITHADQLQPGQQLKVLRGPFSALIDLSQRKITLMLDRRYAGQFSIEVDPITSVEEGHWSVNQKLLTPGSMGLQNTSPTTPTEERSLMLTNTSGETSQLAILRGASSTPSGAVDPTGRVIRLSSADVEDVYDILSIGSEVVIRR